MTFRLCVTGTQYARTLRIVAVFFPKRAIRPQRAGGSSTAECGVQAVVEGQLNVAEGTLGRLLHQKGQEGGQWHGQGTIGGIRNNA